MKIYYSSPTPLNSLFSFYNWHLLIILVIYRISYTKCLQRAYFEPEWIFNCSLAIRAFEIQKFASTAIHQKNLLRMHCAVHNTFEFIFNFYNELNSYDFAHSQASKRTGNIMKLGLGEQYCGIFQRAYRKFLVAMSISFLNDLNSVSTAQQRILLIHKIH